MRLTYYTYLLVLISTSVTFSSIGQVDPYEVFKKAQEKAYSQQYEPALGLIDSLLGVYPKNEDFVLFKASILHWSGEDSLANLILDPFLQKTPPNKQAIPIKLQILEADLSWTESALLCQQGKKVDKNLDTFYLFHEALAYYQLERNEEALACLDSLRKKGFVERNEDLRTALLRRSKNAITFGIGATSFPSSTMASWYFSHLQYQRKFNKSSVVARFNYGNVNKLTSTQMEGDYYWNNTKYSNIYLNYGFSPDSNFFSRHRLGFEYFYERKSILASAGMRSLWFTNSNDVLMFTASAGYQYKNWILDYRIFLVQDKPDYVPNHYVYLRYQDDSFERYFQLDFQYGKVPFYYSIAQDFDRRDAYRVGAKMQLRAGDHFFFTPIVAYEIENITETVQRQRIYFQLLFTKRF